MLACPVIYIVLYIHTTFMKIKFSLGFQVKHLIKVKILRSNIPRIFSCTVSLYLNSVNWFYIVLHSFCKGKFCT